MRGIENTPDALAEVLGLFALGDVVHRSGHGGRRTIPVAGDLSLLMDDPHLAVRLNDPVLDVVARAFLDRAADRLAHSAAVVGMDRLQEGVVGGRGGLRLLPEHAVDLVGPVQLAGQNVPVPVADLGDALRRVQIGDGFVQALVQIVVHAVNEQGAEQDQDQGDGAADGGGLDERGADLAHGYLRHHAEIQGGDRLIGGQNFRAAAIPGYHGAGPAGERALHRGVAIAPLSVIQEVFEVIAAATREMELAGIAQRPVVLVSLLYLADGGAGGALVVVVPAEPGIEPGHRLDQTHLGSHDLREAEPFGVEGGVVEQPGRDAGPDQRHRRHDGDQPQQIASAEP